MRVHWDSGVRTYGSAQEAASDLMRRGYELEDVRGDEPDSRISETLRTAGSATWREARRERHQETGERARKCLQEFTKKD